MQAFNPGEMPSLFEVAAQSEGEGLMYVCRAVEGLHTGGAKCFCDPYAGRLADDAGIADLRRRHDAYKPS